MLPIRNVILALVLGALVPSLPFLAKHVQEWEIAHEYPFGKMCQSIFTGYENTCQIK